MNSNIFSRPSLKTWNDVVKKCDQRIALRIDETGARLPNGLFSESEHFDSEFPVLGSFAIVQLTGSPQQNEDRLDELRRNHRIAIGSHVFYDINERIPLVPNGLIYLRCGEKCSPVTVTKMLANRSLNVRRQISKSEIVVSITRESQNPVTVALNLLARKSIIEAQPDFIIPTEDDNTPGNDVSMLSSELGLADQWYLGGSDFRETAIGFVEKSHANVCEAWVRAGSTGNDRAKVAIVDQAFDKSHTDLAPERWVFPYDAMYQNPNRDVGLPNLNRLKTLIRQKIFEDGGKFRRSYSDLWHGTACAGVAIASGDRNGVIGAAPQAKFIPIRKSPNLSSDEIIRIFNHAKSSGAHVVSCSFQVKSRHVTPLVYRAIRECAEGINGQGCIILFSAGNAGGQSINGLAALRELPIKIVGATNSRNMKNRFSQTGPSLWIMAPAGEIGAGTLGMRTTDFIGSFENENVGMLSNGYDAGAYTKAFGDTSGATALVAGISGFLMSLWPTVQASDVIDAIQNTASSVDGTNHSPGSPNDKVGYGRIDTLAALNRLIGKYGDPVI